MGNGGTMSEGEAHAQPGRAKPKDEEIGEDGVNTTKLNGREEGGEREG